MKPQTIEEKVQWCAMLHKQNLNGRETEDELFEAGILAGIEETEELRDEFAIEFVEWIIRGKIRKELLEMFKKEKGL